LQTVISKRIGAFGEYFAPILCVLRSFAPMHARTLVRIGLLGVLASGLNAAGYLALMPLIGFATKANENLELGLWSLPADATGLLLLIGLAVALAIGALEVGYLNYRSALTLVRDTATEAATRGLGQVRSVKPAGRRRRAVNDVLGSVSFGCGILMRQVASGLAEAMELAVFIGVLLWLSPGLTLAFLLCAAVAGLFYARSVGAVTGAIVDNRALAALARDDIKTLATDLDDESEDAGVPAALRERVRLMYKAGPVAELMESKLHIRRETKRGPMMVEYLFPVTLVVFPLLVLPGGHLTDDLGPIIVYLLFLRKVIGLLQGLAGQMMFVGRIHPLLQCYADLQAGTTTPRCPFMGNSAGESLDPDEDI
jgi:hypothetical protein